ncbi:tRNA dihydrouridine(20/20a) synthase DusA [Gammaproteobacteria bacterium]|nr:tRNA dihydrouridine(20/20a) synthase DusA [Gammaproteobacteria bacterium]
MKSHTLQIAPMMGWTHRHFRVLMRLMAGDEALLYSEMVTAQALIHGDLDYLLSKSALEGDVILQIGSGDPELLEHAMRVSKDYGYYGFNLNAGCPSNRVQGANIGACLMKNPQKVRSLMQVMLDSTSSQVSIKTRLGIDGVDSYDFIKSFVSQVQDVGCHHWIIHARDAWLEGLSPKENRSIPPLRYEYVYKLKQDFPHLHITLNGGLVDYDTIQEALKHVDAVMLGRAAYQNMPLIHALGNSSLSYMQAIDAYIKYAIEQLSHSQVKIVIAPLISALCGYNGARAHRRILSEVKTLDDARCALSNLHSQLQDQK